MDTFNYDEFEFRIRGMWWNQEDVVYDVTLVVHDPVTKATWEQVIEVDGCTRNHVISAVYVAVADGRIRQSNKI